MPLGEKYPYNNDMDNYAHFTNQQLAPKMAQNVLEILFGYSFRLTLYARIFTDYINFSQFLFLSLSNCWPTAGCFGRRIPVLEIAQKVIQENDHSCCWLILFIYLIGKKIVGLKNSRPNFLVGRNFSHSPITTSFSPIRYKFFGGNVNQW